MVHDTMVHFIIQYINDIHCEARIPSQVFKLVFMLPYGYLKFAFLIGITFDPTVLKLGITANSDIG